MGEARKQLIGTRGAMASDDDLDKGLYAQPAADTQSQGSNAGGDPTRRVTQKEYDEGVRRDNEKASRNYLLNKRKNGGNYK